MPAVFGNQSGDISLVLDDFVDVDIAIGDTGISFDVAGRVGKMAGTLRNIAMQTVAGPAVPGSGTTYYILQVACEAPSTADGTVSMKSSASATPTVDAGNVLILTSSLPSTANTTLLDDNLVTPDEW